MANLVLKACMDLGDHLEKKVRQVSRVRGASMVLKDTLEFAVFKVKMVCLVRMALMELEVSRVTLEGRVGLAGWLLILGFFFLKSLNVPYRLSATCQKSLRI